MISVLFLKKKNRRPWIRLRESALTTYISTTTIYRGTISSLIIEILKLIMRAMILRFSWLIAGLFDTFVCLTGKKEKSTIIIEEKLKME